MKLNWKTFRPLHKWLVVRADPRSRVTRGGIELPEQLTKAEIVTENTGTILKMGGEVRDAAGVPIEPGDRIVFRGFLKDAFHDFEVDGDETVFLLRIEDVLAIIDKNLRMGVFS